MIYGITHFCKFLMLIILVVQNKYAIWKFNTKHVNVILISCISTQCIEFWKLRSVWTWWPLLTLFSTLDNTCTWNTLHCICSISLFLICMRVVRPLSPLTVTQTTHSHSDKSSQTTQSRVVRPLTVTQTFSHLQG